MAKTPKKSEIKDEPGAEERFARILKRALNTPPSRKQDANKPKHGKRGRATGPGEKDQ
jgi:hypothetical protein